MVTNEACSTELVVSVLYPVCPSRITIFFYCFIKNSWMNSPSMLSLFQSKMAFVGLFFSEVQKCFALLLTLFFDHNYWVQQVYEPIACVQQANENAGILISIVQFHTMILCCAVFLIF